MNKWIKIVAALIVFVAVVGIAYILWWPKPMTNQRNPLQTDLNAIHFIHEENGRKIAEVFAESGGYNLKDQTGEAKNIKVVFYREDGSQWTVTSPKGTIGEKGNKVVFESPIHGEDQQGGRIDCTGKGTYTMDNKKVVLEGPVVAVQKDTMLTGDYLEADINLAHVKVKGKQAKLQKGGIKQ